MSYVKKIITNLCRDLSFIIDVFCLICLMFNVMLTELWLYSPLDLSVYKTTIECLFSLLFIQSFRKQICIDWYWLYTGLHNIEGELSDRFYIYINCSSWWLNFLSCQQWEISFCWININWVIKQGRLKPVVKISSIR